MLSDVAPAGKIWRTGADEATTLTTDKMLMFGEPDDPGRHLHAVHDPRRRAWKLVVNKQTGQSGTEYHEDRDLGRADLKVETLPKPVEQVTIGFGPTNASARLDWGTVARLSAPHGPLSDAAAPMRRPLAAIAVADRPGRAVAFGDVERVEDAERQRLGHHLGALRFELLDVVREVRQMLLVDHHLAPVLEQQVAARRREVLQERAAEERAAAARERRPGAVGAVQLLELLLGPGRTSNCQTTASKTTLPRRVAVPGVPPRDDGTAATVTHAPTALRARSAAGTDARGL